MPFLNELPRLLNAPAFRIDPLPCELPDNPAAEDLRLYLSRHKEKKEYARKFTRILLKARCFYPFTLYVSGDFPKKSYRCARLKELDAKTLKQVVRKLSKTQRGALYAYFPEEDSLLLLEGDWQQATVFQPSERLGRLLEALAEAEGLFWWEEA